MKDKKERNYSLDLLRCISMLMIVGIHINSHGGILNNSDTTLLVGIIQRFMYALCYCSVNVFILISGYFLSEKTNLRLSKVFRLELQTIFYSWVFWVIMYFVKYSPDITSAKCIVKALLPTSHNDQYWFVTMYVGLYLLVPFINILINSMTKKQYTTLIAIIMMLIVWNDISPLSSTFVSNKGFSLIWFLAVYLIAGYIRKYINFANVRKKECFMIYFACTIIITIMWLVIRTLSTKNEYINSKMSFLCGCLFRYDNLINIIQSLSLFIAFAKITINNKQLKRIITFFSPLTFGVYLIHDNINFKFYMWNVIFKTNKIFPDYWMPIKAITLTIGVFSICIFIEWLRKCLFCTLENSKRYQNFCDMLDKIPERITNACLRTKIIK